VGALPFRLKGGKKGNFENIIYLTKKGQGNRNVSFFPQRKKRGKGVRKSKLPVWEALFFWDSPLREKGEKYLLGAKSKLGEKKTRKPNAPKTPKTKLKLRKKGGSVGH